MTRKHFIEFANMLASHAESNGREVLSDEDIETMDSEDYGRWVGYEDGYEAARIDIGRSIAAICRTHNPNFDAARFFDAAKI